MNKAANYTVVLANTEVVVIKDLGPWDEHRTVTNDAEAVVAEMMLVLRGRRLDYIDSAGDRATILIKDGKFAGFAPHQH